MGHIGLQERQHCLNIKMNTCVFIRMVTCSLHKQYLSIINKMVLRNNMFYKLLFGLYLMNIRKFKYYTNTRLNSIWFGKIFIDRVFIELFEKTAN